MRIKLIALAGILLFPNAMADTDVQRLTNVRDMYPCVSPDSSLLVFESNRTGTSQIFAMDVLGDAEFGPVRQLTQAALGAETPVISPDGSKIALSIYTAEGNNDVFVMNIDGSELQQVSFGPGYDGHPHWSSDGERIVFNSDRTTPDRDAEWGERWHEIFSMRRDGSDLRQHTFCKAVCTFGSLSPDGETVLYRKVVAESGLNWALGSIESNSEIFIADKTGGNEVNISNNTAFDGWPRWSPDGKRIVFASNRSGPSLTGNLWTMRADGSDLQQITNDSWSYVQPSWSPDGQSVFAYQSKETAAYEFGAIVRISLPE